MYEQNIIRISLKALNNCSCILHALYQMPRGVIIPSCFFVASFSSGRDECDNHEPLVTNRPSSFWRGQCSTARLNQPLSLWCVCWHLCKCARARTKRKHMSATSRLHRCCLHSWRLKHCGSRIDHVPCIRTGWPKYSRYFICGLSLYIWSIYMYIRSALQKDDLMTFTKQPLSLQSWRFEIFLHHFFLAKLHQHSPKMEKIKSTNEMRTFTLLFTLIKLCLEKN